MIKKIFNLFILICFFSCGQGVGQKGSIPLAKDNKTKPQNNKETKNKTRTLPSENVYSGILRSNIAVVKHV